MQLSAQARYATLQVMGTRLWVPRYQIAGAAASQQCAWPAAVKPASVPKQGLAKPAPAPIKKQPEPKPQPEPVALVQPLYADVWLLANGWLLVMENLTARQGLQADEIQLLQNLLIALYPGGLGISDQQFFSWPLPGIPVEQGNEGELSMSLLAFLTGARFQGVQLAGCLVFGERLPRVMTKAKETFKFYAAPSLPELKQNPAAKQQFWQQAGTSGLRASFASSPILL